MTTYEVIFEASKDIANANNKQKKEAKEIIEESVPTFIDGNKKSGTLVKKTLVRLDLQGHFKRNGIPYANLQIQLNQPRMDTQDEKEDEDIADNALGKPRSTTIAIVLMPSDQNIPENIMKEAFNGSLDDKMKATILKR